MGQAKINKMTSYAAGLGAGLATTWENIWRVLSFSPADDIIAPEENLSVSIDKGNISVAYGSRFLSMIRIRGIKKYPVAEEKYPQPEYLLSSLSLAVNEFGVSRPEITLSIPKAWTIIRTAEFPSTVKENITDVISYELDRLTPFNAGEAFYDFRVLGETCCAEDKGDRISLLLLAAKNDQIKPYIDVLNENGFTVSRITVNFAAIGTLCSYMDRKADTLFVEICDRSYEGGLFVNGLPLYNFSGSLSGLDEKTKMEMISGDIKSLIDKSDRQGKPTRIVAHIKDKNPHIRELLKTSLDIPIRIMAEMESGLRLPLQHKEVPYAAVGSVMQSLWTEAGEINLLKKGHREKQKTPLALTILLLLAILTIWIFYLITPLRVEVMRLQEISSLISTKKEEAKKIESLKKQAESLAAEVAAINIFKKDRPMTLNVLKELTSRLPRTAWISRARITTSSVDIEGYADAATVLLPKLESSKYFKKVEFASSTVRDVRMNADRFSIKMEIENIPRPEDVKLSGMGDGGKIKNETK